MLTVTTFLKSLFFRLTVFIFFLIPSSLYAQNKIPQVAITLAITNLSLTETLSEITTKTGVSFSYNPRKIQGSKIISYKSTEKLLEEVLNDLCELAGLEYQMIEGQMILSPKRKEKLKDQQVTFSGFINDKNSGEPLIGATLFVSDLQLGTTANAFGFFSMTLPKGVYQLSCSYIGYEIATERIDLNTSRSGDITMVPNAPLLEEVIVRGDVEDIVNEVQTSKMELRPQTVEQRPALFGEVDVIKSLESVPGIKLHSDGSTFYSVRGGSRDQNLVMIDDAPIYNPSHLLGLFSTVIPDAVNDITLYKGDMPASMGGRLSSLLDIRTKKGNDQHTQVWGNVGLISTKLGVEGPIKKDESSFLVSARVSRLKWLFGLNNPDLKQFQFYDFTGKVNFRLNEKNRIYFSMYSGGDNFFTGNSGISWANTAATFRWNHIFNDRLFLNTTVSASNYDYFLHTDVANNTRWNSHIANFTIKNYFTFFIRPENQVLFGISLAGYNFNPGNLKSNATTSQVTPVSVKNSSEVILYANHELKLTEKLDINYGARLTSWTNLGEAFEFVFDANRNPIDTLFFSKGQGYKTYVNVEPRLTLRYAINETSSLKVALARNIQNIHLISNSISPFTSLEVWLPSSINIKPQTANQVMVGFYKSLVEQGVSFQLETFYKLMRNQFDFESHAQTLLNPLLEGELRFGNVKAYGLEFLVKKDEGRVRGWVGYSYSRAKRQFDEINDGKTYNAFYDRPHQINLVVAYDVNVRWNLGLNWNFTTGAPFSSPISFYSFNGQQIPIYGQKNNDRLPDYHRLDVSATVRLNKKSESKFQHHLSLSIYNFYGRKNALFINYNKSLEADGSVSIPSNVLETNYIPTQFNLLQLIPSITYNFKWK